MRAYIKQTTESSLFEQARIGFIRMGYETIYYKNIPEELTNEDVVVGYIGDIQRAFLNLGLLVPETIDYPEELDYFLARKIKKIEYKDIPKDKFPYFIKPVQHKAFTGRVINQFRDLTGVPETELYYTENILNICSEYRVYIQNKEIIGCKHYKGNVFISPEEKTVKEMINLYHSQPNTYTLDVGVLDTGETILIEANQGYSCGNYGLTEIQYAKFLRDGYMQYLSL